MKSKFKQKGAATVVALSVILLWIVGIVGWVANLVQVVHQISSPITGLFIIKAIGIVVAPVGVILGWMGIF